MRSKAIVFFLIGAAVGSAALLLFRGWKTDAAAARITRDGVLMEEIDLSHVDAPYSLTFEDESGTNTVRVERGRIRVSEADCPDQICVHQGWISDSAIPIVCLPHRLMIEIVGAGGDLDAGAG